MISNMASTVYSETTIPMDDKKEQLDDPLIDEVRERRRQLSSRYGNDLQELFKAIRELQKEHPRIVLKPQ